MACSAFLLKTLGINCHGLRSPVLAFSRYYPIVKFKFSKHLGDYSYGVDSLRDQKAKGLGLRPVLLAAMVKMV
jgi:hypothetical protein